MGVGWIAACVIAFCTCAAAMDGADASADAPMMNAFQNRSWTEAAKLARERLDADPHTADAWYVLGSALQSLDDLDGALDAFEKLGSDGGQPLLSHLHCASVFAQKGDVEQATRVLDAAAAAGFSSAVELGIDRAFDSVRDDARYLAVLKKIEANARAAQARGERLMFSTQTERTSARLVLYGGYDTLRVVIDHGVVPWRDGYEKALTSKEFDDRRWRVGANDWTTLDTNVGLSLGDIDVPAGEYGLTIRKEAGGRLMLELHDMKLMRQQRVDPYYCQALPVPPLQVELDLEDLDDPAKNLVISMAPAQADDGHVCELRIDFGPHRLTTTMVLQEK